MPLYSLTLFVAVAGLAFAQGHVPQPRDQPNEDPAAVARGHALFKSTCGFCHGEDATGSRAPDLVRSPLVNHDDHGNLLGPVIRNGRPDKSPKDLASTAPPISDPLRSGRNLRLDVK